MLHMNDKDETELSKAAKLADVFSLIHRSVPSGEKKPFPVIGGKPGGSSIKDVNTVDSSCNFVVLCWPSHKELCNVAKNVTFSKSIASLNTPSVSPSSDAFQSFISQGTVALNMDSKAYTLQIMRDTASAQLIMLKSALPGIEQQYTGEKVFLNDFHKAFSVSLARERLDCR